MTNKKDDGNSNGHLFATWRQLVGCRSKVTVAAWVRVAPVGAVAVPVTVML